jgi:uncharacterized protein (DUF1501 family)
VGSATVSASASAPSSASSVLVVLSLRGGADGLSLVVPYGDPGYQAARPNIAIPQDQLVAGTTDGFFGLHPKLAPLKDMWTSGKLAAIHATGLSSPDRSHFSAMEEVEEAHPGSNARVGWLNRLVGTHADGSPLQGVGIVHGTPPTEISGPVPLMTIGSLDDATIAGDDANDTTHGRRRSLHTLWDHDHSAMGTAVRATLQATSDIQPAIDATDNSGNNVYPKTDLARGLAAAARIIRGDIGTEVITVDQGAWDMHVNLGTLSSGEMLGNADDLGRSVAAFFADLGTFADKVTLVTISEFGRRVVENGNRGLDHGWGNVMFVAGAGVKGGKVYLKDGTWNDLAGHLESDLVVTTDYRNVLAEIVQSRFGSGSPISTVFPGLTYQPTGFMV